MDTTPRMETSAPPTAAPIIAAMKGFMLGRLTP